MLRMHESKTVNMIQFRGRCGGVQRDGVRLAISSSPV